MVPPMVLVSKPQRHWCVRKGDFFKSLPWLVLPMEGFECLSLTNNDLVFAYTLEQLCHHEAAQALLTILPLEGIERKI
jgi:hypothetical protein